MGGGGGKGGGGSTNMDVKVSGTTTVLSDVDINGLDNIKTDNTSRLILETPAPLASATTTELAVTEPIVTDSTAKLDATGRLDTNSAVNLDIKPLVTDACIRLELGKVPPTRVCQPYRGHVGFTIFGVEIFGVTSSGEAQVIVEDLPRRPDVVWADDEPQHRIAPKAHASPPPAATHRHAAPALPGGLRIRLGP